MKKKDIRTLSLEELQAFFVEMGAQKFRAKQVYEWLWKKGAYTFEEMTNLSKTLREQLKEVFVIWPITEDLSQHSNDGTIKTRFRLHDGHLIESVLIPVPQQNRYTVCISSQVGCSLSCKFCATGQMDRLRNSKLLSIPLGITFSTFDMLGRFCLSSKKMIRMGISLEAWSTRMAWTKILR